MFMIVTSRTCMYCILFILYIIYSGNQKFIHYQKLEVPPGYEKEFLITNIMFTIINNNNNNNNQRQTPLELPTLS